jgi:hypothetical protein
MSVIAFGAMIKLNSFNDTIALAGVENTQKGIVLSVVADELKICIFLFFFQHVIFVGFRVVFHLFI